MNYVFVLDSNKIPLDPCHPSVARKLLKKGKAAIFRRYPFTIILKRNINTKITQSIALKLDPGSKTTGIALVTNDKVIWGANLQHRGSQIKSDLDSRRAIRKSRRNRQTRYRKPRFLNRTRKKGWLAPSLEHRVLTTITWVKRLLKVCPITSVVQELVKFDTQRLVNPEITGEQYQQGTLQGYEIREYLLEKWSRRCAYCGIENVPLQIEHIKPKAKGGTDRVSNLCLACEKCNQKKGTKELENFLKGKPELLSKIIKQAQTPLKDASAVNSTRWKLYKVLKELGLPVSTGTGGQTKYNRTRFGFNKDHWLDAACTGNVDNIILKTKQPILIKATGHGNRRLCRIDKYGFPCSVARKVYNTGWKTGDIARITKTRGKHIGVHIGRIVVQNEKTLELRNGKTRISGKLSEFKKLHSKDGYKYEF